MSSLIKISFDNSFTGIVLSKYGRDQVIKMLDSERDRLSIDNKNVVFCYYINGEFIKYK
jgi:hypothetical protein